MTYYIGLPYRALSVRQPWAWAIIHGGKDIENRGRAPEGAKHLIGKRFMIHASGGMLRKEYNAAAEFMASINVKCPRPEDLVRGALVGHVALQGIVSESESDWFFGPRGLVLTDPREIDPVPVVGCLGFYDWRARIGGEKRSPDRWMLHWPHKAGRRAKVLVEPEQERLL